MTHCLKAITGALTAAKIQGTVLSILFALAISIAAAEKGAGKNKDGVGWKGSTGEPLSAGEVRLPGEPLFGSNAGVMIGLLKQRR